MRGFDSWAGTIKSGGKTRRAAKMQILDCEHGDIKKFVSMKRIEEEKAWALIRQGYPRGFDTPGGAYDSVFFQNSNLSVRVTDDFMKSVIDRSSFNTKTRAGEILDELDAAEIMQDISSCTWVCGDPGLQFDTTINDWHTCPNSGRINASNPCSEYMHVDDSACNLASLNLLRFVFDDGEFDVGRFRTAIDILITAQDILIDSSSYPTSTIARNATAFRQLGLGYANLGALLMRKGVAYDSPEGRAIASTITAIMCGQAYVTSARLAKERGAFSEYAKNRSAMLGVHLIHSNGWCSLFEKVRPNWGEGSRKSAAMSSFSKFLPRLNLMASMPNNTACGYRGVVQAQHILLPV
jgi:ribonucleoside-diphosphate reductase alpha chain